MGLAMYATRVEADNVINALEYDTNRPNTELFYWRKNRHLHNWMDSLYQKNGGVSEFNCTPVQVNEEDLNQLNEDIINRNLIDTTGFFFGTGDYTSFNEEEDLDFIRVAKEVIYEGDAVYYIAWH